MLLRDKLSELIHGRFRVTPSPNSLHIFTFQALFSLTIYLSIRQNMEGTSFAIPINKIKAIVNDLAHGKHITHGYIGVSMATLTPDIAQQNNLDPNSSNGILPPVHGVVVTRVFAKTPADMAGIRRLDVIVEIANKRVERADDAQRIIDGAKIGEVKVIQSFLICCAISYK
jgi:S1-C subfamily serine protease